MDLVQEDQRDLMFSDREKDLKKLSLPLECKCFRTSIWDETLYKVKIIFYFYNLVSSNKIEDYHECCHFLLGVEFYCVHADPQRDDCGREVERAGGDPGRVRNPSV